jgi:hypothetical protein
VGDWVGYTVRRDTVTSTAVSSLAFGTGHPMTTSCRTTPSTAVPCPSPSTPMHTHLYPCIHIHPHVGHGGREKVGLERRRQTVRQGRQAGSAVPRWRRLRRRGASVKGATAASQPPTTAASARAPSHLLPSNCQLLLRLHRSLSTLPHSLLSM